MFGLYHCCCTKGNVLLKLIGNRGLLGRAALLMLVNTNDFIFGLRILIQLLLRIFHSGGNYVSFLPVRKLKFPFFGFAKNLRPSFGRKIVSQNHIALIFLLYSFFCEAIVLPKDWKSFSGTRFQRFHIVCCWQGAKAGKVYNAFFRWWVG